MFYDKTTGVPMTEFLVHRDAEDRREAEEEAEEAGRELRWIHAEFFTLYPRQKNHCGPATEYCPHSPPCRR